MMETKQIKVDKFDLGSLVAGEIFTSVEGTELIIEKRKASGITIRLDNKLNVIERKEYERDSSNGFYYVKNRTIISGESQEYKDYLSQLKEAKII